MDILIHISHRIITHQHHLLRIILRNGTTALPAAVQGDANTAVVQGKMNTPRTKDVEFVVALASAQDVMVEVDITHNEIYHRK